MASEGERKWSSFPWHPRSHKGETRGTAIFKDDPGEPTHGGYTIRREWTADSRAHKSDKETITPVNFTSIETTNLLANHVDVSDSLHCRAGRCSGYLLSLHDNS